MKTHKRHDSTEAIVDNIRKNFERVNPLSENDMEKVVDVTESIEMEKSAKTSYVDDDIVAK